jgi:hypothetical protein
MIGEGRRDERQGDGCLAYIFILLLLVHVYYIFSFLYSPSNNKVGPSSDIGMEY